MKSYYGILFFMLCFLSGCNSVSTKSLLYDPGISEELARLRKQEVKELKYELFFSIPKEKTTPIEGNIVVRFNLQKAQEVILDFREEQKNIKTITSNGKMAVYQFINEHIIIPKKYVVKGHNEIQIRFTAGNQSLNRNDDFLYTLLVPDRARTVFPCFEQPNLKAEFTLTLEVPSEWKAVSNTYQTEEKPEKNDRKTIYFAPTEPLSTYLFSFVTGKLEKREYKEGKRTISAYYRETDPKKVAQLDTIFKQVVSSLNWLEEYTGIPYPFAKYDFIILPGFQYGGMEHTGATLYNDNQMFLSEHPTPDEELRRTQLIAHETAHMWFGDLVTMDWFNDVWTKEVFANYFAAAITEPLFPNVNHALNRMRVFTASSLSEDRTLGTTSIRQPLDNLRNAGLIYGQIIYNKAPVMMAKMVELMGKENFRNGIQEYLKTYAYGNATWDNLIKILDAKTEVDLAAFSDTWVNQKGMPTVTFEITGKQLVIKQKDPYGRGLNWPQRFNVTFCGVKDSTIEVQLTDEQVVLELPFEVTHILPNSDGRGYGLFIPDKGSLSWLLEHWQEINDDTSRYAHLMILFENYLAKNIADDAWMKALFNGIKVEKNPLTASSLAGLFASPLRATPQDKRESVELELYKLSEEHPITSCRMQLLRMLIYQNASDKVRDKLYEVWQNRSNKLLNERDYISLAYELSLRMPDKSQQILAMQRSRITDPDRLREFDFIARAMNQDQAQLDSLFQSLLQADNRRIEPWTASVLSYLNHPLRQKTSVKYIRPGLEILEEVQRTGDIFFPRNWVSALLGGYHSKAAYLEVKNFLDNHPNYPPLLKNKILQAAYPLYREFGPTKPM